MTTLRYDAGAAAYDRLTGRWSALFAAAALDTVIDSSTNDVLDLATGTGDGALLAARRLEPTAVVVGADLSVPMLLVAESKRATERIDFIACDAQRLPFRNGSFDAVICLFGLMFFPDARRALTEVRRLLRSGGGFAATAWGTPTAAPFAGYIAEALAEALPADRDELLRPFSLADPVRVKRLLCEAGYANVEVRREVRTARFSSFADYWHPVEAGGGRLGQAYLGLSPKKRDEVRDRVQEWLAPLTREGQIAMGIEAQLAVGRS
jgi:SAM-dependent methyltransferase